MPCSQRCVPSFPARIIGRWPLAWTALLACAAPAQGPAAKALVQGRCIAAESNAPLQGVIVQAGMAPGSFLLKDSIAPRPGGAAPESTTTGADGRFSLRFTPPPESNQGVMILVTTPGRVPRGGMWTVPRPIPTIELGDVTLAPGFTVNGEVVDGKGAPVQGVGLFLPHALLMLEPERSVQFRLSARSDEQGRFTFNGPVPAGTWPLGISGLRNKLESPASITVRAGKEEAVKVVVQVDAAVAEDAVKAPPFTPPSAPTGKLTFELTVVEQGGKPVEEFGVRCHPVRQSASRGTELRLDGRHEAGKVTVDNVSEVEHSLVVVPRDPALETRVMTVQAKDGKVEPVRVELERQHPFVCLVQRPDGTPVVGSCCQLCDPAGAEVDVKTNFQDMTRPSAEGPGSGPRLLTSGITDDAGRVVLYRKRELQNQHVRVLGPGHVPVFVAVRAGADPQVIEIANGPIIEGKVQPAATAALWQPKLEVLPAGVPFPRGRRGSRSIGSEGRFVIADLEPGEYVVMPIVCVTTNRLTGGSQGYVQLVGAERTVKLEGKGPVAVTIDLATWMPVTLPGFVCDETGAACAGSVQLMGERSGQRWQCGEFALDAAGRFQADGLLPGKYRVRWRRSAEDREPKLHPDEIELEPGKVVPLHQFRFGKE